MTQIADGASVVEDDTQDASVPVAPSIFRRQDLNENRRLESVIPRRARRDNSERVMKMTALSLPSPPQRYATRPCRACPLNWDA